jgi:hypothetical protein
VASRDNKGGNSGWQALGTWGVPGTTLPGPSVVGVTPARSGGTGIQNLTFTFADTNGWQDLGVVDILINDSLDGNKACYLAYIPASDTMVILNDPGTFPAQVTTLFYGSAIGNSQCTASGTYYPASESGNTLSFSLNLTFSSTFAGNRIIYMAARSNGDTQNSGWQAVGTVTIQ